MKLKEYKMLFMELIKYINEGKKNGGHGKYNYEIISNCEYGTCIINLLPISSK